MIIDFTQTSMERRLKRWIIVPETVGAFPIRQDITVLPEDDPRKLKLGWVIYEEIGIVVINERAITKIAV